MSRNLPQGVLVIVGVLLASLPAASQTWVADTFADFRDGTFDAAGHNLYVSARGQVKTIHRFDLNHDGWLDLVFNSSHDFVTTPRAAVHVLPTGRGPGRTIELPVHGSVLVAVADLNGDGRLDAVFGPNHDWITHRRFAFILWGDERGWSGRRMTPLICAEPRALAIADLDADGHADLLVLNGARWAPEDGREKALRVYWNGEQSFEQGVYSDRWFDDATDMAAVDLDGDERPEIVVLHASTPPALSVFWNDGLARDVASWPEPQRLSIDAESVTGLVVADVDADGRLDLLMRGGSRESVGEDPTTGKQRFRTMGLVLVGAAAEPRQWSAPRRLAAPPASAMACSDLNEDGRPDLVLADSSVAEPTSVRVLFGRPDAAFDPEHAAVLPVAYASAVAAADLDGDGHQDLVIGVHQTAETYQAASRVFYGDGRGGFEPAGFTIPTASVRDVAVVPLDDGGGHRLLFCNGIRGRIREDVPVRVFWGDARGFEADRFSTYGIRSGFSSTAADLNDDGYPDMLLSSIVHNVADQHELIGINILWGAEGGLADDRRTVLHEYGVLGQNVADLDRDGHLDIVTTANRRLSPDQPIGLAIWHGSPDGYKRERRVLIPFDHRIGLTAIADYNRDGRLDIATSALDVNRLHVLWGDDAGYSADRRFTMPMTGCDDVQAADLDADGWIDLVATSYILPKTNDYDFGTHIFWGGPGGFDPTRAQRLPGNAGFGIAVADYDSDGHLDLFVANYKNTRTRQSLPCYLYWGGADGFDAKRRSELIADSGTGAMAADFNGDGRIDVAIASHSYDGNHIVDSRVYYNDGRRFRDPDVTFLPSVGPHHMHDSVIGHIGDRVYRQVYTSSAFQWDGPRAGGVLTCTAQTPEHARLELSVRAAAGPAGLDAAPWHDLADDADARRFDLAPGDRCLQYRAVFRSDNGDRYPVLDRVEITLHE